MALVLVQHLDPTQESMLADILGRESKMPVSEAVQGVRVEPDHVYVIPPNTTMRLTGGLLALKRRPKPPTPVLPIDILLRSLADECGSLAIGVVLSGTGADGVAGLAAIREAGGLTFAQDPSTAEYDGMPRASMDAGVVDEALDVEAIAAELMRIGSHPHLREAPPAAPPLGTEEEPFAEILSLVRDATGLDLSNYRKTTLVRRISRRMLLEDVTTIKDYLRALKEHPSKIEALYRDVLVNMTEFFRDPEALDALKHEVFPKLLVREESDAPIRVWIPGCSKGQEAYSILIMLVEALEGEVSPAAIQMFASDVNELDIEVARAGIYPQAITREVSSERLSRFFVQVAGGYQIDRAIREMCVFAVHDVTKDPPFSKLDLVSFRNVLIYMELPLQQRVLQTLHYALEPGAFLMLGPSESVGAESTMFSVLDKKHRIFERMPGPARLLSATGTRAGRADRASRREAVGAAPAFDVLAEVEKIVRDGYQLPGILVNVDLDVLQFRGHMAPYLDPADGPPVLRVQNLFPTGLCSTVEAAIRDAAKTGGSAKRPGTVSDSHGHRRRVDVEAVPIPAPAGQTYYLVVFDDRARKTPEPESQTEAGQEHAVDANEPSSLRRELEESREQLEVVLSGRRSANSDLRALSERLQSSNEELRTINEEFQTAQEELQSTNEELTTLNDELRNRNTELGRLADDLNNVIEGVEIPILILDTEQRIRRFAPQAQVIVDIVPSDVGRPITAFRLKVDVPDFTERVRQVLQDGAESESEVRGVEGGWYSMRIRPYTTSQGVIDGVVVAFIDIDELKKSMEAAQAARGHAEAVVETVLEPLLTLGQDMTVHEANDAFYATFAVTANETIGRPLYELGDGQWDFPELRSLLDKVLPGDHEFADLEVERDFPRVGHRIMVLYARRIREKQGQPSILLAIDDVTRLRRHQRLNSALNNVSTTIATALEFDKILEHVLRESSEALGAVSAAVLLKQDDTWVVRNAYGLPREVIGTVWDAEGIPGDVTYSETGEPVLLDPAQMQRLVSSLRVESDVGSVVVVPLLLRKEEIGSVSFHYRSHVIALGDSEIDFSRRLGTLLSLAFENASLYSTQREIADTLQKALLAVPKRIPGVDFGYLYRSATTSAVGGDFYDLFELERGRVGILLGDVSGKGVHAATLTALVKNTVRAFAYEHDSPAVVAGKANAVIFKATGYSTFVTLMFCVLDPASGRLVYCSAGHTRSIVKMSAGDTRQLHVGSPIMGAFETVEFSDGETTLEHGDVLVLYTDGVTEARRDGEMFGEDRLVDFVGSMGTMRSKKMPDAIFKEVQRYTGGKLSDDVAIVAVALGGR